MVELWGKRGTRTIHRLLGNEKCLFKSPYLIKPQLKVPLTFYHNGLMLNAKRTLEWFASKIVTETSKGYVCYKFHVSFSKIIATYPEVPP